MQSITRGVGMGSRVLLFFALLPMSYFANLLLRKGVEFAERGRWYCVQGKVTFIQTLAV